MDQDAYVYAFGLLNLAQIDIMIGTSSKDVQQNLDKAKGILDTLQDPRTTNFCYMLSADLTLREGGTIVAKIGFYQSLDLAGQNNIQAVLYALERLADMSRWPSTEFDSASTWTVVYQGYATKIKDKLALHKALQFMGQMFLSQGDEETAWSLFIVALEGFTLMDIHHNRAQCMVCLGDISERRGDWEGAIQLWDEARQLFERSLQGKYLVQIDNRLAAVKQKLDTHENLRKLVLN
ncbi:hypothetical protein C8R44DRAFT_732646 [Mycena epipterygia]|nr:hypothetical protein C8R44DRAFT_732646 [Mycena epipterygia]